MTQHTTHFPRARRSRLVAPLLAAAVSFAPMLALAAGNEAQENRAEMRIKDMHARLNIAPAQEAQWTAVATIMRDNAVIMDKLTQARVDQAKDATAVDDLKSYGEISEAHAEGIKKLTPAFMTLYAAMSEAQKKQADLLFREGEKAQGGNDVAAKSPKAK